MELTRCKFHIFFSLIILFSFNHVGRKILTKVIVISSILDDTYEAYGTFEELPIFTQTIPFDKFIVYIILFKK